MKELLIKLYDCTVKLAKYSWESKLNGRLSKKDFIIWNIIVVVYSLGLGLLFGVLHIGGSFIAGFKLGFFIVNILTLIPNFILTILRIHDIGYTGWLILASFIPIIGIIFLAILLLLDGKPEANKYGEPIQIC